MDTLDLMTCVKVTKYSMGNKILALKKIRKKLFIHR